LFQRHQGTPFSSSSIINVKKKLTKVNSYIFYWGNIILKSIFVTLLVFFKINRAVQNNKDFYIHSVFFSQ
jgi:hypothetical protein